MTKAEEGDFLVRANVSSHDEIGLLASTFNKMLAKITDLRVERIESEREMSQVMDELSLKAELAKKSEQLEAANQRLEARLKQLSFLNQLGRDLSSRLDLDYLLDLLSSRLPETFNVPAVSILLFEKSSNHLRVIKARGADEAEVAGRPFDAEHHPGGGAVKSKEPTYQATTVSHFWVPLIYQDSVIGLFGFTSPHANAFTEEDRELFMTVASQASLALANAQLFQETLELSLKDGLTGILNRRALESRLELEWSRALRDQAPLSIVMVDIDHFKVYNDQHGHQLGDETLRRVARLIERNIRKVDAVARYGGEEFAIILPRAGKKEAIEVAKKLRRSVEQADFVRGYLQPLGRVTISCGVSTAPDDATSVEDLIKKADEALFAAKESGRNTVRAFGETVVESGGAESAQ
jgi:diguanylate cyclase (GGDEF)-like protein